MYLINFHSKDRRVEETDTESEEDTSPRIRFLEEYFEQSNWRQNW
jgi:hypothetical protein